MVHTVARPLLSACFPLIDSGPKLIFVMLQHMAHMSLAPVSCVVADIHVRHHGIELYYMRATRIHCESFYA
jgi:hypothetical protein